MGPTASGVPVNITSPAANSNDEDKMAMIRVPTMFCSMFSRLEEARHEFYSVRTLGGILAAIAYDGDCSYSCSEVHSHIALV